MRHIIRNISILSLLCLLCGCTQNDGMIGTWFGIWALDEIKIDGETDQNYTEGSTFFSFQADVIRVNKVENDILTEDRYGMWDSSDGYLTVDFSHYDNLEDAGTSRYESPKWIYITEPITRLKMLEKTSRHMVLENGKYTYFFRKTY